MKTKMYNGFDIEVIGKKEYESLPQKTINQIVDIAFDAFGPGMTVQEVFDHVYGTDTLYLVYEGEEIQGFETTTIKPDHVYLCGAAVRQKSQMKGIGKAMMSKGIEEALKHKTKALGFNTQNPIVFKGMKSNLDSYVQKKKIIGYSIKTVLKEKVCGRMLNDGKPKCGVKEIDKIFDVLNYEQGDTINFMIYLEMKK